MRKVFCLWILTAALFCCAVCAPASGSGAGFDFTYPSLTGHADCVSRMYYDDSLFDAPSTVYNPSLATASMTLEMTCFGSTAGSWTEKSKHAQALLEKIGFTGFAVNAYFREQPGTDSVGCVFAHKEIGGRIMVFCGIRGGNYGAEWASSLTVGVGVEQDYHQGFYEASGICLDGLREYIAAQGITGSVRLWIVGFSRGGAVCNITAGRIDEAIRDGESILGDGVEIARDDLYAYCFAAPRGVPCGESMYPRSELFSNIFCVVNFNDAVPLLLGDMQFTRYGVDRILYDRVNDLNYSEDIRKMLSFYNSYQNADVLGSYVIPDFEMKRFSGLKLKEDVLYYNWPQGVWAREFLYSLTVYGIRTREYYTENLQPGLRDIVRFLYANGGPSTTIVDLGLQILRDLELGNSSDLLLDDLLYNPRRFPADFKVVLTRSFNALKIDINTKTVVQAVENLLWAMADAAAADRSFSGLLPLVSRKNLTGLVQAHLPETYLAFLRSMDPWYLSDPVSCSLDGRYWLLEVHDETADLRVTLGDQELAKFADGMPVYVGSQIPYGKPDGLCVYLPWGGDYTIVCSTDDVSVRLCEPMTDSWRDCYFITEKNGDAFWITVSY